MTKIHTNLWLTSVTPEYHAKTCGYWYLVTTDHMSYKAFASRSCLYRWLGERGLDIDDSKLAPHGQYSTQKISGTFAENFTMSVEDFDNLPNVILETRQVDNGEYTLVRITRDETGMRTANGLNCNVKSRVKFDYWESDEMCCGRVVVDGRESRGYRMADNAPMEIGER